MLGRDGFPTGVPCFIDLSPPDPEAATRFYGALFGWTFEDRMPPDAPGHFFAAKLHGREVTAISSPMEGSQAAWATYVAVDSADDVARGVQDAGFEDAIGWMAPFDDGDDADPHWAVTFAVDGTDAVADRAAELGAMVLTAPYDAGPVRVAVLRDPQGAEFTVSTYAPQG